ncbi:hypothetical protein B0O99DRAFT_626449 [Bisporella sp. PMI_857]|nr:hypothetical protein B0O99DRAFT_626449 [Bisporella sp. PMI_857]
MTTLILRSPRCLISTSSPYQLSLRPGTVRHATTLQKKHQQPLKAVLKSAPAKPQQKQALPSKQVQKYLTSAKQSLPPKSTILVNSASKQRIDALSPISDSAISTHSVNGPTTTLPAPLDLPVRQANQALFKYLFKLGKGYAGFYKTGVKNIWNNYKAALPIQDRVKQKYKGSISIAVREGGLNRQEFQLLRRNWHDIRRVPVFGIVFMICGEFTPLVVLALSNVVPWTCRIPKQIKGDRQKLEERRKISFRNLTLPSTAATKIDSLQRVQLLHISWSLGLSSRIWDWLFPGKLPGLPTAILKSRVRQQLDYFELDDLLINKAGGAKYMNEGELLMACVERGIDVLGRPVEQIRNDLSNWLQAKHKATAEHLLLTRPSVWPSKS